MNAIKADAQAEAEEIISSAQKNAEETISVARKQAEAELEEAKKEGAEAAARIRSGKMAQARLDGAKVLLAEKRRVLDEIYARALKRLLSLPEKESLALYEKLLAENAEEGDTVLLAASCGIGDKIRALPVAAQRKLKFSKESADIEGGLLLRGKTSDKNLSFASLLQADMDEHQAELAIRLFIKV